MEQNNKPAEAPRTALQRIEDLEKAVMSVFQVVNQMGNDIGTIKEAVKLLGNKVDAIVKATQRNQPLTDDTISQIMVENNIEDLKQRVEGYKAQGFFVPQEAIDDNSFVVGQETDKDGKVVQPRMQFGFSALAQEVKDKLRGAKVGDIIDFGENKYKFQVQEVYLVVDPNAPKVVPVQADPAPVAEAPASAPVVETPATEVVTTEPTNVVMD